MLPQTIHFDDIENENHLKQRLFVFCFFGVIWRPSWLLHYFVVQICGRFLKLLRGAPWRVDPDEAGLPKGGRWGGSKPLVLEPHGEDNRMGRNP